MGETLLLTASIIAGILILAYILLRAVTGFRRVRGYVTIGETMGEHRDVIEECLKLFETQSTSQELEAAVKGCLALIAKRENCYNLDPAVRESFSRAHPELTHEFDEMKRFLEDRFRSRAEEVIRRQIEDRANEIAREQTLESERIARQKWLFERELDELSAWLMRERKEIVDKFLEIAERKVSAVDDYGDENWKVLPKEIEKCQEKLFALDWKELQEKEPMPEEEANLLMRKSSNARFVLERLFRNYHDNQRCELCELTEIDEMSGIEFEAWLRKLLSRDGFDDVRGTPASGDQGADLIVKSKGKTIVVQAKRSGNHVGNRAVQEAIAAVQFYEADEGWVVTNSRFTGSARSLAQRASIKLIDRAGLARIRSNSGGWPTEAEHPSG